MRVLTISVSLLDPLRLLTRRQNSIQPPFLIAKTSNGDVLIFPVGSPKRWSATPDTVERTTY
jgi:hypothetical protein